MTSPDPGAFVSEKLGPGASSVKQIGSELMKSGEFARTVQGATTAGLKAQAAAKEAMSRALAAANMPSREDMIDMAARMRGVERSQPVAMAR